MGRIGEAVGHGDIATTARHYTHVLTDGRELDYAELLAVRASWGHLDPGHPESPQLTMAHGRGVCRSLAREPHRPKDSANGRLVRLSRLDPHEQRLAAHVQEDLLPTREEIDSALNAE